MSTEIKPVNQKLFKLEYPGEEPVPWRPTTPQLGLCPKCVELRLTETLYDIKAETKPLEESWERLDVKIADVGQYYRHKRANGCNLCDMLSASRVSGRWPQYHEDADELHVYRLSNHLSSVDSSLDRPQESDHPWRGDSSMILAVVPSGFNQRVNENLEQHGEENGLMVIGWRARYKSEIYVPQIVNPLFDLSLAHGWLQYCIKHHRRLCSMETEATTELRLIDCRSLRVIPGPAQAEYTALSYVWGVTSPSESPVLLGANGGELPSSLPAVIFDAISVTKTLGFQYLWVDRYCIDQDGPSKHQQIRQMDSIYQNAQLTIVAAAGNGPEYGLPGISSQSRCGQQTCTIANIDIIQIMRHPHSTIQLSKWSSRGWTFQEAALSRRNLVFTDDQVYFECNAMNCHESLSSDLDILHTRDRSQFRDILQAGLFGRTEKQKYGRFDQSELSPAENLVRFMGMVEQYTARDLTYDTDSLNAFTGIIRKFETAEAAVNQIWGVPFRCREGEKETIDSFVDGLAWSHNATAYGRDVHPRRRPGFPSWSWAGWAGEIQYPNRSLSGRPAQLDSDVGSVYIETVDGRKTNLSAYIHMAEAVSQESGSPPAIHIQALALPASAFTHDTSTTSPGLQVFGYPARLALSTGPWDVSGLFQSLQNTNQRQCVYLGHVLGSITILVLEAQDDSWSRVGMISFSMPHPRHSWGWREEFTTKSRAKRLILQGRHLGEEATSYRVI